MIGALFREPSGMEARSISERMHPACENDDWVGIVLPGDGGDRISELPDNLLHHIFSFLPIKYAAQATVLSKRWSSFWDSLPDLDFTSKSVTCPPKTMDFIDEVLARRDNHCGLRTLRFRGRLSCSRLHHIILAAFRLNVQEIEMNIETDDCLTLPSCMVSSKSLRVLKFRSSSPFCGVRLLPSPVMIEGFQLLRSMHLSFVRTGHTPFLDDLFTEGSFPALKTLDLDVCFGLKRLRVACPALEEVSLMTCLALCELEIRGEKLEMVRVERCFTDFHHKTATFVNITAPNLTKLCWRYNGVLHNYHLERLHSLGKASLRAFVFRFPPDLEEFRRFSSLISGLSHSRQLTLDYKCLQLLESAIFFGACLRPLYGVKQLHLRLSLRNTTANELACLLERCPHIEKLALKFTDKCGQEGGHLKSKMQSSKEEQYWNLRAPNLKAFLHNLRLVKMQGNLAQASKLVFFKFLLQRSIALEEVIFRGHHDSVESTKQIFEQLIRCWALPPGLKNKYEYIDDARIAMDEII